MNYKEADLKEFSLRWYLSIRFLEDTLTGDRYESKLGMMPVPKIMLATLIDKTMQLAVDAGVSGVDSYRDKIVKNAVEIAFSLMKDSVLFMKKKYTLWTVLAVLQEYMKISGITADYTIEAGNKHVFVIQHEARRKLVNIRKRAFISHFHDISRGKG